MLAHNTQKRNGGYGLTEKSIITCHYEKVVIMPRRQNRLSIVCILNRYRSAVLFTAAPGCLLSLAEAMDFPFK